MRFLAVLPLLASMCAPAAQDAKPAAEPDAQPARTSPTATVRTGLVAALEVLHDWDAERARAWARADPAELRALYVRGSAAGLSDVWLLRYYEARGLVVR